MYHRNKNQLKYNLFSSERKIKKHNLDSNDKDENPKKVRTESGSYSKSWLQLHASPMEGVLLHLEKSYELRRQEISLYKKSSDFFVQYPIFKDPNGVIYVGSLNYNDYFLINRLFFNR